MKSVYYGKLVGKNFSDKEEVLFEYVDISMSGILFAAEASTGVPASKLIKEYQLDTANNQLKVEVSGINDNDIFEDIQSAGYILIEKRLVSENEKLSQRFMETRVRRYTA